VPTFQAPNVILGPRVFRLGLKFRSNSSWLNLIERFFGEFAADCIRDGSFQNVRELVDSVVD
jgi:hypothetical protein